MEGSLTPVMYWAVRTNLCSDRGRAVAIPGGDSTSQDALDVAAVEHFEDLRTHAKYFQSPEEE